MNMDKDYDPLKSVFTVTHLSVTRDK